MTLSTVHLPQPKNWQDFERATRALFSKVLQDPNTAANGRSGQPQHGVDVFGRRNGGCWVGIQCKMSSDAITQTELDSEVSKAINFDPPITEFHLVTTAPRDQAIQTTARQITTRLSTTSRPLEVRVWGWEDIEEEAANHADVHKAFDPTWDPYSEAGFERISLQLNALSPPVAADLVSPIDRQLYTNFKGIMTPHVLEFLAQQDFGAPLFLASLNPIEIVADWMGANYEFVDPELHDLFEPIKAHSRTLLELTGSYIFIMDNNEKLGWPKTDEDRRKGLTQRTRENIKEMNNQAHVLWHAIDDFVRIARQKGVA